MKRISDLKIQPVQYMHNGALVEGSNLLYLLDGRPASARVPWVAVNAAAEAARLERRLVRVGK